MEGMKTMNMTRIMLLVAVLYIFFSKESKDEAECSDNNNINHGISYISHEFAGGYTQLRADYCMSYYKYILGFCFGSIFGAHLPSSKSYEKNENEIGSSSGKVENKINVTLPSGWHTTLSIEDYCLGSAGSGLCAKHPASHKNCTDNKSGYADQIVEPKNIVSPSNCTDEKTDGDSANHCADKSFHELPPGISADCRCVGWHRANKQ